MNKQTLSVVLAVLNEETNLGRCLDSIRNIANEIIIVDEGSIDKTLDIAKLYKARIIKTTHQKNFHISKNIAIDAAKSDWTLQLDADEAISTELSNEILTKINSNPIENGYWVNRKNWFLYKFLTKGGQYPDPTLRLYRTGKGRLPAKDVHEQAQVEGKVGYLHNDLHHYRDVTFEKYIGGFNRYSSFIANQHIENKLVINISNTFKYLVTNPLFTFINIFIRHRGYVDGMAGFIFALYSGLIHPVSYIKYWQISNYD